MSNFSPALSAGRHRLAAVVSSAGDVICIGDAERTLGVSRTKAAKLLAGWANQGWLRRVGPGAYVAAALELLDAEQVVEDPWILVPALFGNAYIGGRTAAEHWDLTEQIFRDIVVFTTKPVRKRSIKIQGGSFTLKHIKEQLVFGTKNVWRGRTRIAVSDIHRTIIDMLDDPAVGGGIQHVADCVAAYLARRDADPEFLIDYAERLGNGAVLKRLGYLAERQHASAALIQSAAHRLTTGYSKLDPALACPKIVTRWRLRVPETWKEPRS